MAGQTAALSSKANTRVVAYVINGSVYSILATSEGLRSCLLRHKGNQQRHDRMPNLQEFAQMVEAIEVLLPDDPNVNSPKLTRLIEIGKFIESGENYRDKGSSLVDHQPARPVRSVA